jgi:uncharacterized damage-inducible protein DinB
MTSLLRAARDLLAYTVWADRAQLGALEQVDAVDLSRDTGSSHGSLAGTLAHMLGAQRLWLSRFLGNPLPTLPGVAEYPDLAAVRAGFEEHWPELEFFLASLSDEALAVEVRWVDERGAALAQPLWQPLLHAATHDGYHRGQITTMLRQLGYQPPSTDLVAYFATR